MYSFIHDISGRASFTSLYFLNDERMSTISSLIRIYHVLLYVQHNHHRQPYQKLDNESEEDEVKKTLTINVRNICSSKYAVRSFVSVFQERQHMRIISESQSMKKKEYI
jgi:hypothetical protein